MKCVQLTYHSLHVMTYKYQQGQRDGLCRKGNEENLALVQLQ